MGINAYLCAPGFEDALIREIGPGARTIVAGLVTGPSVSPEASDYVYARHVFPEAWRVTGSSIRGLARAILDAVWPALKAQMAWRLDVVTTDAPVEPNQPGELARRARLLDDVLREEVQKRRTALFRVLGTGAASPRLQILLVERDEVLVSFTTPEVLACGDLWPSAFPAGRAVVAEHRDPPSSAYRKLLEALRWHGCGPRAGDRVVDLGASPGGWSWVALEAGATVTGVDKGAMAEPILAHPRFTHARTDAFRWQPPEPPVDWLVCDIIAEPERSAELLVRWANARWFRSAVLHLKIHGEAKPELARQTVAAVRGAGYGYVRAKQLRYDKNELTLLIRETLVRQAP